MSDSIPEKPGPYDYGFPNGFIFSNVETYDNPVFTNCWFGSFPSDPPVETEPGIVWTRTDGKTWRVVITR